MSRDYEYSASIDVDAAPDRMITQLQQALTSAAAANPTKYSLPQTTDGGLSLTITTRRLRVAVEFRAVANEKGGTTLTETDRGVSSRRGPARLSDIAGRLALRASLRAVMPGLAVVARNEIG